MTEQKLKDDEINRYSRQIIVPSIGVKGQLKLKSSKVLVIGAGGLGCPVIAYLSGAGIGTIGILDYDTIDRTNLHRQFIHKECEGITKAESAKSFVKERNPNVNVVIYNTLLNSSNALDIVSQFDIIVDCSDNVATRYLVNDASVMLKKPLVSGSALQMEGQLTVYNYKNGPCYRCIFPQPPPTECVQNCGDFGVLGPITGVIGSLQATEAIKIILEHEHVLAQKMLIYDASTCSFRTIKMRGRKSDCVVCGDNPTITQLIDYEQFCGLPAQDKDPKLKILSREERVSVEEYETLRQTNDTHLLIDVRTPNEFEMAHLHEQSINIPLKNMLSGKIDEGLLNKMQNTNVIVLCKRGNDSQIAVRYLRKQHDVKAKDIIGGLYEWWMKKEQKAPLY